MTNKSKERQCFGHAGRKDACLLSLSAGQQVYIGSRRPIEGIEVILANDLAFGLDNNHLILVADPVEDVVKPVKAVQTRSQLKVSLTSKLEELVDQLAENTHNIWARERILQGWTYGLNEDPVMHRSPHLVSYGNVDDAIKKANRDTASETIRTLLVYGYILEAPTGDQAEAAAAAIQSIKRGTAHRTYRLENTNAVTSGKWYFEMEVLTSGPMRVGWIETSSPPGTELGCDDKSWAFDGFREEKCHSGGLDSYGHKWQVGDVVGVCLDIFDRTIKHNERQVSLRALRNRQDLFQEEGILNLILDAIDKITIITQQGYLVALAGEEAGLDWDIISGYLYQLLAAVIKGNHTNCSQFANSHRLNWLFSRLGSAGEGTGMLDVLHCVLIDSPEALNVMKEDRSNQDDKLIILNAYSPPASNTWTKEDLDDKREGLILVTKEIMVRADKDKSRLLVLGDFKAIDWEAYESRRNQNQDGRWGRTGWDTAVSGDIKRGRLQRFYSETNKRKVVFLGQLVRIEDLLEPYKRTFLNSEEENEDLKSQINEQELGETIQPSELGKEFMKENPFATQMEDATRHLEKYKEEMKETYAQVVNDKETIKELKVSLTSKLEELVDQLAENTHNIWARERILQGWTYGLNEDPVMHRSPHLVSYGNVDDAIKKANRDTASETIRTLLVYGYILEAPTGDQAEAAAAAIQSIKRGTAHRTYRLENTNAVTSGKWYFEMEVLTSGPMRVGWIETSSPPGTELGCDDKSWAFDGFREEKCHSGGLDSYGHKWQVGDVVGVCLDIFDRTISE
ncbi:ryanodine receptor-like [Procambarus clarkii]|uniref:ryanodine receptor-like n=1 Tax=Procambarus clarkii TaxID=6728 RepID=UPI003744666E